MADDIEGGSGADPEGGEDLELEAARASFERVAEEVGLPDAEPAEEAPVRPVWTPRSAPAEGGDAPPAAPDLRRAHTRFMERIESDRRVESQRALDAALSRFERESEAPAAPVAAPSPPEDPEPDREEDFWGWHAWDQRRLQRELLSAFDERLQPLVQRDAQLREREQAEAEWRERQEREDQWRGEMANLARVGHEIYVEEEPAYMERVVWLAGDPRDPQGDSALGLAFESAGWPRAEARQAAVRFVHAIQDRAIRAGQNPAAALDGFVKALAHSASYFYRGASSAAAPSPEPRPAPAARGRIRDMNASARSGVAGSASVAGEGPKDLNSALRAAAASGELDDLTNLRAIAKTHKVTMTELTKAIKALGRSPEAA
jgi:hypothetical protein